MYAAILDNVADDATIKTVIVTMNLRSFAAYVMYTPITNSIRQRMIMLDNNYPPLLNRFFLIFKKSTAYNGNEFKAMKLTDWKSDKIVIGNYNTLYDMKTAYENGEYIDFNENFTDQMKEKGIAHISNYAFQIDTKMNPRINDFDKLVTLAKKRNWKLIFHLLPENIEKSKSLFGDDLNNLINYNRQLLLQRYNNDEVTVIDNMNLLLENEFIEENPNSHFHYNGRKLMAERIANSLTKPITPND